MLLFINADVRVQCKLHVEYVYHSYFLFKYSYIYKNAIFNIVLVFRKWFYCMTWLKIMLILSRDVYDISNSCADPESFSRGDPILTSIFVADEGVQRN